MKYNIESEKDFFESYDVTKFDRPSVSVDNILFTISSRKSENYRKLSKKNLQILLVKRSKPPFKDFFALPGTFVSNTESLNETATRCLMEKTNIKDIYLEQLYTFGEIDRDPRTRVISCTYMSLVKKANLELKPGQNIESVDFFSINTKIEDFEKVENENGYTTKYITVLELSSETKMITAKVQTEKRLIGTNSAVTYTVLDSGELAFDHAKTIIYALDRLKNKVEYTDISFNLMPDLFTLTELQICYEILLDKQLLTANFRRKIAKMVIETDEVTKGAGHRPSKLFKFNPNWYTSEF